jgi:hypothetical protein
MPAAFVKPCQKILKKFMEYPDAEPFLTAVDWKAWGLYDYPKIVKNPMDLATVQKKLNGGKYSNPSDFAKDVRQIWKNCQLYNQDGSDFHTLSVDFAGRFEDAFSKVKSVGDDGDHGAPAVRQPTLDDKTRFSQSIYKISSEELGKVVEALDARCEAAIDKTFPDEIEINVDVIDADTFHHLEKMVSGFLPGEKKKKKSSSSDDHKSKKQRS